MDTQQNKREELELELTLLLLLLFYYCYFLINFIFHVAGKS